MAGQFCLGNCITLILFERVNVVKCFNKKRHIVNTKPDIICVSLSTPMLCVYFFISFELIKIGTYEFPFVV